MMKMHTCHSKLRRIYRAIRAEHPRSLPWRFQPPEAAGQGFMLMHY